MDISTQSLQTPPSAETPPAPLPATTGKRPNWLVPILGIVFLIFLIGAGGYYSVARQKNNTTPVSTSPTQTLIQPSPSTQPTLPSTLASCLDGSTFRSVKEFELGLGPNGPVKGAWRITFTDGTFQWTHSDLAESGTYTCSNNVLKITFPNQSVSASRPISPRYDESRKILTWDGEEYVTE